MGLLRLRELFRERGITGIAFANHFGFNKNTATNLINNKSFPSGKDLKAIAEFLDVDIRELFNPTKDAALLNGFVEYAGEIHRIQSEEDLQKLLDLIKEG